MYMDLWHGHRLEEVAAVSVSFSDIDCIYRGNLYSKEGRIIGDFASRDSVEVERHFPGIFGKEGATV